MITKLEIRIFTDETLIEIGCNEGLFNLTIGQETLFNLQAVDVKEISEKLAAFVELNKKEEK